MMFTILQGNCIDQLKTIEAGSIQCVVTSPPYWGLRDYGVADQLGLEPTPEEYVASMVEVFREVKRVLRDDGTTWLNLGDSYAGGGKGNYGKGISTHGGTVSKHPKGSDFKYPGLKTKDLIGIPWMVAFALRADGWYLRQDIIWHKPNPMPESVTDRCTKAHEYIFLLTKSAKYYYDAEAVKEKSNYPGQGGAAIGHVTHNQPGSRRLDEESYKSCRGETRNKRSVWTVSTQPYPGAHFATFPPKLIEPCILAGSSYKACEVCGGAWERVTEKHKAEKTNPRPFSKPGNEKDRNDVGRIYEETVNVTTGWQPTCTCEQNGTGKSIVLDPFAGSGTTLMVAEENGRDSIGIELNPEYVKLIEGRMSEIQGRLIFE